SQEPRLSSRRRGARKPAPTRARVRGEGESARRVRDVSLLASRSLEDALEQALPVLRVDMRAVDTSAAVDEVLLSVPRQQRVRTGTSDDPVHARPAVDSVVARAAVERVVSAAPGDQIRTAEPADHVVVLRPDQHVGMCGPDNRATVPGSGEDLANPG